MSISPRFESQSSYKVTTLVLPKISGYSVNESQNRTLWPHLEGLKLADPNFLRSGKIDLLLGSEIHALIVKYPVRKGSPGKPIATDTALG